MWKPARALRLRPDDREWLEALVHGGKTPQRVVLRARIVLGAAAGQSNHGLAKALGISRPTLLRWRQRYVEAGVGGLLKDAPRPGRHKRIRPEKVEAKSQIQALDRTEPILPLRPGLPARQTHDYTRHGTTTLFAALNVLEGRVIEACQPRHTHAEFLAFLDKIDRQTARKRDIHLILDNYATHKHPTVKAWRLEHPRFHFHFTPTGTSWLNLVERFFAEITRKRIRRGTFRSVPALIAAIRAYVREHNKHPRPFIWTATVATILRKIKHCKQALETGH